MRFATLISTVQQFRCNIEKYIFRNHFPFQQVQFAGMNLDTLPSGESSNESSIFSDFLWFAAPKSKISPSRKKAKHGRYFPKRVDWSTCERCGEAKRPHRICTDNVEICAMRDEDWQGYKKSMGN
ncbi:hypothetical protein B484DRAFT_447546 [Ochromonadaceae sp. CCMP2298]|nr:hypothetical protein B484DRAFT_447546 [Ochromonadaceae sp. CCMP2298]